MYYYISCNNNNYNTMNDLDEMVKTMSDKDVRDYLESCDADIYCCSPDCLDNQYLDAGI